MKKFLVMIMAIMMTLCFAGCGSEPAPAPEPVDYEVGFVVDDVVLDENPVNEAIWDGIVDFGEENAVAHKAFIPDEKTTEGYLASVSDAVKSGVNVIVMSGEDMIDAVNKAAEKNKKVDFIYIDEVTAKKYSSKKVKPLKNVMKITFAEEQAGYLAGYAAVCDGYRSIAFAGEDDTKDIRNYGVGFVQGAEEAAQEIGVTQLTIKYKYMDNMKRVAVRKQAARWYKSGTEVIFACGDRMDAPVIKAAEMTGGKVIGADVDKSDLSKTVITSAIKKFDSAISFSLLQHFDGDFKGGKTYRLAAEESGIGLPMKASEFEEFNKGDYSKVYERIQDGLLKVKSADKISLSEIDLKIAELEVQ